MGLFDEFSEWKARLVEVQQEHRVLLKCPVRRRDLVDGPEERIRQGLLHFFVELAKTTPYELRAEYQRHDIKLHWPKSDGFRPRVPPLLIVETKVDGAAVEATNRQLTRYLNETAGDCGVVFTGYRMWRLELSPDGPRQVQMSSLTELADLVRTRATFDPLADERARFWSAVGGNLESLKYLVARFPYATFVLSIGGRETRCRCLRFSAGSIEYRPADQFVRKPVRIADTDVCLMRVEQ